MNILDKIKGRTNIDVDIFVERLKKDFNIDKIENEEKKEIANDEMLNSIYEVLILILDKIHQSKVPVGLYTTWLQMVRDYWYLNKYDKKYVWREKAMSIKKEEQLKITELLLFTVKFRKRARKYKYWVCKINCVFITENSTHHF